MFNLWKEKFDLEKIEVLNKQGKNLKEISEILEIPTRRFGEMCKYFKVNIVNKGYLLKKNHDYFKIIDSEAKAYILGYILADGCVCIEPKRKNGKIYSYNKRITFCSSIDDISAITLIQQELSPQSKITQFHNAKGAIKRKEQVYLKISSSKIVDDLINIYNIKPNKTYDFTFMFPFDKIPQKFKYDFIRGFMDGDGWISAKSGCIGFIGTAKCFIEQIASEIKKDIPNLSYRIQSFQGLNLETFDLNLNKQSSLDLMDLIYNEPKHYLERKFIKAQQHRANFRNKKSEIV